MLSKYSTSVGFGFFTRSLISAGKSEQEALMKSWNSADSKMKGDSANFWIYVLSKRVLSIFVASVFKLIKDFGGIGGM